MTLLAQILVGIVAEPVGLQAKVFFLICVVIAGLYGAKTVSSRILFIQAVPAVLALAAVLLSR